MVQIKPDNFIVPHPKQVNSLLQDGVMFLSTSNNEFYSANSMALRIWNLIGDKIQVEMLIQQLLPLYDASEKEIRNDVLAFLQEMINYELIEMDSHG
jgi:hypothetical protein